MKPIKEPPVLNGIVVIIVLISFNLNMFSSVFMRLLESIDARLLIINLTIARCVLLVKKELRHMVSHPQSKGTTCHLKSKQYKTQGLFRHWTQYL